MVRSRAPELERGPGTYVLVLRCDADARVRIGRLGLLQLQPGFYLYAGSALGPGGVRGRLAHHRKIARRPRWHVDYLRCRVQLAEMWYALGAHRCEHEWAGLLEGAPGVSVPLAGFGSSDCNCESHLFFFRERPSYDSFVRKLHWLYPASEPVRYVQWPAPTSPTS